MSTEPNLRLHRGVLVEAEMRVAYARLMREVLGVVLTEADIRYGTATFSTWTSFCYFGTDGKCVANVDAAILPLVVDFAVIDTAAIRSVAVDPAWRGQGLFRNLMFEALAWCDARAQIALLFTAEPELYGRFGFDPIAQHAFVGPTPAPSACAPARRLDLSRAADEALIRTHVERRSAVSGHVALRVDTPLYMTNLVKDDAPILALAADLDALIAYEEEDDVLVVADIAAPVIPRLAQVVGALHPSAKCVKTLFPPDRLNWQGEPVREDTGLMVRGGIPAAMTRPFMVPPTAEF